MWVKIFGYSYEIFSLLLTPRHFKTEYAQKVTTVMYHWYTCKNTAYIKSFKVEESPGFKNWMHQWKLPNFSCIRYTHFYDPVPREGYFKGFNLLSTADINLWVHTSVNGFKCCQDIIIIHLHNTHAFKHYKKLKTLWYIYVTGFAKMCIVHTSTFSTLKIHKICYAYQTGMKLARIVAVLSLYLSRKFQIVMFILSCFMNLWMCKIGCVNYARFPKSGHI